MVLDTSVRRQKYVEDCEACCKPIQITYTLTADAKILEFEANRLG
jgi:hypothetical protein